MLRLSWLLGSDVFSFLVCLQRDSQPRLCCVSASRRSQQFARRGRASRTTDCVSTQPVPHSSWLFNFAASLQRNVPFLFSVELQFHAPRDANASEITHSFLSEVRRCRRHRRFHHRTTLQRQIHVELLKTLLSIDCPREMRTQLYIKSYLCHTALRPAIFDYSR